GRLRCPGLSGSEKCLRGPRYRETCTGESQGSHGSQSADRRSDQDPGQTRGEVPRFQGCQRRHPRQEVVESPNQAVARSLQELSAADLAKEKGRLPRGRRPSSLIHTPQLLPRYGRPRNEASRRFLISELMSGYECVGPSPLPPNPSWPT